MKKAFYTCLDSPTSAAQYVDTPISRGRRHALLLLEVPPPLRFSFARKSSLGTATASLEFVLSFLPLSPLGIDAESTACICSGDIRTTVRQLRTCGTRRLGPQRQGSFSSPTLSPLYFMLSMQMSFRALFGCSRPYVSNIHPQALAVDVPACTSCLEGVGVLHHF